MIGINLYSVRHACRTEADLDTTLGRLKALGYPSVQVSGIGPIAAVRVKALLDKHGLVACAAHDSWDALTQRPDEVIGKLKTLGCGFTALGYPGDDKLTAEGLPALRDGLLAAAQALAAAGLKLGYHNHSQEFRPYDGTSMLSWLFKQWPEVVYAEPDVAWIQQGGGNPEAWLRRLQGRVPAVHLKDYVWGDGRSHVCEVGRGNLDWPGIFRALHDTGVPVWIVEQDDPFEDRDLFESAALSLEFVRGFL